SMGEITSRMKAMEFPAADAVVGIQTGGRIPAALLSFHLGLPLYMLPINFRDDDNNPRYEEPRVLGKYKDLPPSASRVLLVDDVSVSGKTMAKARELLPGFEVTTFVMKGRADLVLFPEIKPCVNWPWLSA
ncbi:MAG: phosphoribosyltransferase, partial [Lysobacterales bacterium]